MAGRGIVYNNITTPEKLAECNQDNIQLGEDFLDYLSSIDRSPKTIHAYRSDLLIFWVYCMEHLNNKNFVELSKRDIAKFQNYCLNVWSWSPNRMRRVKSVLSSMSSYIENMLDDEIKDFKPIVRKIENPVKETVREKTVLSEEQLQFLLDELVNRKRYQAACAIALAAYSGARKAELTRFKVSYFNDENIIYDAMWKTPEKIRTKGRGGRIGKPLTKYVLLDFRKYLDLWLEERKRLGIESEWLLVSRDGDGWCQMRVAAIDSYATECTKILGIPFYPHCLRHMLCSTMLGKYNLPSSIIQEYFGWTSQEMISVYSDIEMSDEFGKYFGVDGIKVVEQTNISDIGK